MKKLYLSPAYGRDYKNLDEAIADWENRKDFVANSEGYINITDYKDSCEKMHIVFLNRRGSLLSCLV